MFGRKRKESLINTLTDRVLGLSKDQRALWARMVELEVERKRHDGTINCPGCHWDDTDALPAVLNKAIRKILKEELASAKFSIKI